MCIQNILARVGFRDSQSEVGESWSDSGGFKLRCWRSKSRSFGLHPRPRFPVISRCWRCWDERFGTKNYCTATSATSCTSWLTCTVYCLFVPIPQTVNIFAKFRESTDRHVSSKLIRWNYAPDMLKSTQTRVCRCLQKELCSLQHTYTQRLKEGMVQACHVDATLVLAMDTTRPCCAAICSGSFWDWPTHLFVFCSRGSYLPLQIVKDSCRQDSKQIRVDTSSPWSTCICILRPALQAWDCFVTVCHSVIGSLPFFDYVDVL